MIWSASTMQERKWLARHIALIESPHDRRDAFESLRRFFTFADLDVDREVSRRVQEATKK